MKWEIYKIGKQTNKQTIERTKREKSKQRKA